MIVGAVAVVLQKFSISMGVSPLFVLSRVLIHFDHTPMKLWCRELIKRKKKKKSSKSRLLVPRTGFCIGSGLDAFCYNAIKCILSLLTISRLLKLLEQSLC